MRAIPSHPVLHVVVSYAASALQQHYPWLRRALRADFELLDGKRYTEEQTFSAMAASHVLISTSSSFSVAAASFARIGSQLHLLYPPKEAIWQMDRANALPAGLKVTL
uniref:Uncharacterized protein n=1 Tax=Prymnesium polylepis TaxID=72548 RepID=A0A7S4MFR6_9EUKA|mmetsp:Transcript_26898/g.66587  ORF Transcript_26898/g.66587 Transcript_26898/m.66587 type:complete len:108 (+) Transcript_26898:729-1052(+)